MPYNLVLTLADLQSLRHSREQLSKDCFNNITEPSDCMHHLLPAKVTQNVPLDYATLILSTS